MNGETTQPAEFLVATNLCDWQNERVGKTAKQIVGDAATSSDRALRIFRFVRDEIRFSVSYSESTASQTWYRWVKAKTESLQGLIPEFVYRRMPQVASHFWCECFLAPNWVSCEGLLDRDLYEALVRADPATRDRIPTIDWDGESDLTVFDHWITEDRGDVFPSWDQALAVLRQSDEGMPPRFLEKLLRGVLYIPFVRASERMRSGGRTA
jgi:hypothetical protein